MSPANQRVSAWQNQAGGGPAWNTDHLIAVMKSIRTFNFDFEYAAEVELLYN